MQVYDISIAPNESRQIDVQASYIYFLNGSAGGADSTIGFRPETGGETVYLKPGQAYELAERDRVYSRWTIFNLKGEGTIIGQVLMGEGRFSDNRISGSVEVIDGGKNRTLAGVGFLGFASGAQGSSAGNYSVGGIWNPPGSGVNVVLEKITMSNGATQTAHAVRWTNTALPNLNAAPAVNKEIGGPASVAQVRWGWLAGPVGTMMYMAWVNPYVLIEFQPAAPIVIPPGFGVSASPENPQLGIQLTFDYYEDRL